MSITSASYPYGTNLINFWAFVLQEKIKNEK